MSKWTDSLKDDVFCRLCECKSQEEDVPVLINARWKWMKENGKNKDGLTKEDAVIFVFELLDSNSQYYLCDVTKEEYDNLKAETDDDYDKYTVPDLKIVE